MISVPDPIERGHLRTSGLLRLYADVVEELRRRKVTRSANNPVADYTEYLVAAALGLQPVTKSTTGYDAVDSDGNRYEIKGRRLTPQNPSRQLSAIRGLDKTHFAFLVGVLFNPDFTVHRGCVVPYSVVLGKAVYRKHPNAWILLLHDEVWGLAGVRDVTQQLQLVQSQGDA